MPAKFNIVLNIENVAALKALQATGKGFDDVNQKSTSVFGTMQGTLSGIGTKVTALSFGFNQVTQTLGSIARVADAPIEKFQGLETKMANVKSLGVKNITALRAEVLSLTRDIPKSADELGASLYDVVSAGVDASNQIGVLELSAKAATAGLASTSDALNLSSAVVKGFGKEWTSTESILDQAFQTVKYGQTTFPELAAAIPKVTAQTSALGISTEELFGVYAELTGVTGNAAEVSTQYKAILTSLSAPTDELTQLVKEAGYATVEMAVENEGLGGILEIVQKETAGSSTKMNELFGSAEAVTAMLALTGNSFEGYNKKAQEMTKSSGAMEQAFKDNLDTGDNLDQLFRNRLNESLITLGARIVPVKQHFLQMGTEVLERTTPGMERLAGHISDLMMKLSESGLETAVRQLKEMGAEAAQLADLEELLLLENATEKIVNANSDLNKLLKSQVGILSGDMLQALNAERQTITITKGRRKEILKLQDVEKINLADIETMVEKIKDENAGYFADLKTGNDREKKAAEKAINLNARRIRLLTQAKMIVNNRIKAEEMLAGKIAETTAKINSQNKASNKTETITKDIAKIEIPPLPALRLKPMKLEPIRFEISNFYDDLTAMHDLHYAAGAITEESYYEGKRRVLVAHMAVLDQNNSEEYQKYYELKQKLKALDEEEAVSKKANIEKWAGYFSAAVSSIGGLYTQYLGLQQQQAQQAYDKEMANIENTIGAEKRKLQQKIENNRKLGIDTEKLEEQMEVLDAREKARIDAASDLKDEAAEKQKKISIAQTWIASLHAAVQAYKALAGIPVIGPALGAAAGFAALKFGKEQVDLIKSAPAMRAGGMVDEAANIISIGNFGDGENRLIRANSGEFIVNAEATANNRELLEYINNFKLPYIIDVPPSRANGGIINEVDGPHYTPQSTPTNNVSSQPQVSFDTDTQDIVHLLEQILATINTTELKADIDASELAILVEKGQEALGRRTYGG